jgi:kynurenine 3-monooxygenase
MRDKVGDPKFLLQKKIEAAFSKKYPEQWIPAYSQVTFSPQIRYSDALKNSIKQQVIMDVIMQIEGIEEKWQEDFVEEKMLTLIGG